MGTYKRIKGLSWATVVTVMLLLQAYAAEAPPSANKTAPAGEDPAKLVGRWQRPDGGYILQLSNPGPDGRLEGAYFNPRPIHVSRAAWKHHQGVLGVMIELRAPNYPGSTYMLAYDAARDRLVGIYFQAAIRQQFEVVFERIP